MITVMAGILHSYDEAFERRLYSACLRNAKPPPKQPKKKRDFEMTLYEVAERIFIEEYVIAELSGKPPPKKPLTRERVRQIEAAALRKLRKLFEKPEYREWLPD